MHIVDGRRAGNLRREPIEVDHDLPHIGCIGIGGDDQRRVGRHADRSEPVERDPVGREEAGLRTRFHDQTGDGCTIAHAEARDARSAELQRQVVAAVLPENPHQRQHDILPGDARLKRAFDPYLE